MKDSDLQALIELRMGVGLLGEEHQVWWPTAFLGRNASAFMGPVFGTNTLLAQLPGVTEAHAASMTIGSALVGCITVAPVAGLEMDLAPNSDLYSASAVVLEVLPGSVSFVILSRPRKRMGARNV